MCGIYGIVRSEKRVYENELRIMGEKLKHRGRDDEGIFLHDNIGLGHKRLSIIDVTNGKQPMTNEDGTVWIVFNGAVYNYLELRQELVQKGHNIKTYCDTEVIIHAYEEYGKDCVSRFNGMFSFVIWDQNKQEIFAARDRFGVKPFYYSMEDGDFIFASEIKALLSYNPALRKVNMKGLKDYYVFQYTLADKTLFEGVKKLEPGYHLTIKINDGFRANIEQYWDFNFNYDLYHTEDYFVDKVRFLLEDAVKIRLRSDVPVGAHLSGGLDSSSVVSFAASLLEGMNIKTFTGGFSDSKEYDETYYAKLVAKHSKADYYEIFPTASDFADSIQDIIYYLDEPGAGPGVFPQYMVSKLASQHVKVVLGGQGGDEIFAGYARYMVAYLEESLKGAIEDTANRGEFVTTLSSIIPNLNLLSNYKPMLQHFFKEGLFGPQDQRYFRLIDRSEGMKDVLDSDLFTESSSYSVFDDYQKIFNRSNATSYLDKMLYFDVKASLPALLHVEDRTSMAVGLESRLPLLDYRLMELVATIPPVIKFQSGKSKNILKQAVKNHVPDEIINRKDKMGFPVPLNEWYQKDLNGFIKEILLDPRTANRGYYNVTEIEQILSKQTKFSRVMWGLLCLELWFREFID
ncbi:asparagine synthase (glutamine-hydrolyzing) [Brevibacillus brevis]|uniref:asparagine synthase (glutamine-hydrolyzing) n=1 Tax=Brevibacillus brevis TaxID=1393 RepID=UPI000D0FAB50|nr:asparagine synthase (glutamine-hydrolyzing) [Brevibacillus brevis]PSJ68371.1 asparagine synthase (glutamine-hydrolyzing) [Brevibacillus brevis]RED34336.1 asparagine synthase (glutamine-hydrolysing) [Brevibacillus brevis]GEC91574.1 asparagine synthetase B [Brevibacillus brevis]VEF92094.1 Asparagine synthetase [glutamine-hydrolyzing] 1 [Brevibacillus brevis]